MTRYLSQSLTAKSILLVEDDSNDVILVRRAFRKAKIEIPIHIVSDGEEAISYLTHQAPYEDREKYPLPTLILLDLKLPRVTGLELLDWLRSQPQFRRLLVVVLTSSEESPDVNKAYDLGTNSYLIKPVEFNDLVALMRTVHSYWLEINQRPLVAL